VLPYLTKGKAHTHRYNKNTKHSSEKQPKERKGSMHLEQKNRRREIERN
jgi:hypothetical protein